MNIHNICTLKKRKNRSTKDWKNKEMGPTTNAFLKIYGKPTP